MGVGPSAISQHEADLALVERLLAREASAVDAGTTTLLLWKCRRDPRLVAAAAAWLERQSDARQAFDGVELYLPQLAHMLVHLDVDWPAGTLERFALVVAMQSPHLALQLHWILRAAMEDYAPRADGRGGSELYYRRCAHLDEDVETVVAHGAARRYELEELFATGAIGRDELGSRSRRETASLAKRLVETALRPMLRAVEGGTRVSLVDPNFVPHREASFEAPLRWRPPPRACAPRWHAVRAKIEGRSLLLYRGSRLVRALPLDGAHVVRARSRRRFEFVVSPRQSASFASARLAAPTEDQRAEWVRRLLAEATRVPRPPPPEDPAAAETAEPPSPQRSQMEATSRRRYEFFEHEREFVESLVDVAETLRAMPREARQRELARCLRAVVVPRLAYLPLCNSTDKWRTVLSVVADDGRVFNTKERCPCLLYFETAYERRLEGLDVANVVHAYVAQNKLHRDYETYGGGPADDDDVKSDRGASLDDLKGLESALVHTRRWFLHDDDLLVGRTSVIFDRSALLDRVTRLVDALNHRDRTESDSL